MVVGDEIAVAGDDETGAEPLHRHPLAAMGHRWHRELFEEWRERTVFVILIREAAHDHSRLFFPGDRDIDHRRRVLLDQRAEIRDGHFHPDGWRGIGRQSRWQGAYCQNGAAGRQNHRSR